MSNSNIQYTPTTWVDHFEDPITGEVLQQGTDVNAENLNKIEAGISNAVEGANQANQDIAEHAKSTALHVSPTEKASWNAKQNALPNIMQTSVPQTMTAELTAGGTQTEATSQVRNAVILPSGTVDFTAIPNNTLICVKK